MNDRRLDRGDPAKQQNPAYEPCDTHARLRPGVFFVGYASRRAEPICPGREGLPSFVSPNVRSASSAFSMLRVNAWGEP